MKLNNYSAPHIRAQENNRTLMSDVILLLLVLCVPATLFYGLRAVALCAVAVVVAVAADTLCVLMRGRRVNVRDWSAVVTGLIIALCMPATIDYQILVTAVLFAIFVVKHPFGGVGNNLFNPAAAGVSFAAVCWPQQVFMYPQPFEQLPVWGKAAAPLFQNPSFVLKVGGIPTNDITEMFLGHYPGPMGATNILVLLACLIFLLHRRTIQWQLPLLYLGSCMLIAFLFPRANTSGIQSVMFEMMSGSLLFGAVFVLTDPATRPKRKSSLAVYGVFSGVATMLFRYVGGFEESMTFAILFANAFVPLIDRYNESLHHIARRKRFEFDKAEKTQNA